MHLFMETPVKKTKKNENELSILQVYYLVKFVSFYRSGYPLDFLNETYLLVEPSHILSQLQ